MAIQLLYTSARAVFLCDPIKVGEGDQSVFIASNAELTARFAFGYLYS